MSIYIYVLSTWLVSQLFCTTTFGPQKSLWYLKIGQEKKTRINP